MNIFFIITMWLQVTPYNLNSPIDIPCDVLDTNQDGYVYYDDLLGNLDLSMNNLLDNVYIVNRFDECLEEPYIEMQPSHVDEGDIFIIQIHMPVGNLFRAMLVSSAPFPIWLPDSSTNCMVFEAIDNGIPEGNRMLHFTIVIYDIDYGIAWFLPVDIELGD